MLWSEIQSGFQGKATGDRENPETSVVTVTPEPGIDVDILIESSFEPRQILIDPEVRVFQLQRRSGRRSL